MLARARYRAAGLALAVVLTGAMFVLTGVQTAVAQGTPAVPSVAPTNLNVPETVVNSANATPPSVTLLAGGAGTPFSWNNSYPLPFTVPVGISQVAYAWTLGGNYSPFQPPVLPSGMSVAATIGYAGIAIGNLTPGTYSTNLSYPGFLNTYSIAIYGVSGSNNSYQFSSISQLNPNPYSAVQVNMALPPGGAEYLALATTGGTFPVNNSSLSIVDEQAVALRGGPTGLIGRQSSNVVSFTTVALGEGIVGMAIDANVSSPAVAVQLLNAFSLTTGGWDLNFSVPFVVPAGVSTVLYLWALGGNFTPFVPPTLPTGMTVAASDGFEGVAIGNLSTGTYSTDLSYAGWTNFASIAIYGVSGPNVTYQFGTVNATNPSFPSPQQLNLSLPSGGVEYLGALSSGGTYAVDNLSLSHIDTQAWAILGGLTGLIGRQWSNVLSFSTLALGYGIAGVGIYSNTSSISAPVTFEETGLPSGYHWMLSVAGSTLSTTAGSVVLTGLGRSLPYVIAGPSGYRVSGIAPTGTITANGAPVTETFRFARAGTVDLRFREQGLAKGVTWCLEVSGWLECSSSTTISYSDLTPAAYTYDIVPLTTYSAAAKLGHALIPLQGTLRLSRSQTVDVRFQDPAPVIFRASGLPPGTSWSLTVKGLRYTSTNSTIVVDLNPGAYRYTVHSPSGYTVSGSPRLARVNGEPTVVSIAFSSKA